MSFDVGPGRVPAGTIRRSGRTRVIALGGRIRWRHSMGGFRGELMPGGRICGNSNHAPWHGQRLVGTDAGRSMVRMREALRLTLSQPQRHRLRQGSTAAGRDPAGQRIVLGDRFLASASSLRRPTKFAERSHDRLIVRVVITPFTWACWRLDIGRQHAQAGPGQGISLRRTRRR